MKKLWILALVTLALNMVGCSAPAAPTTPAKTEQNYYVNYQDIAIAIDADAAPILRALGEANSITETPSCAFDGAEKTYFYGSFYLTTYPKNGIERVCRLWFVDDGIATAEGLRIGDSKAKVEELYAAVCGECPVVGLVQKDSQLIILLDNDIVTSIQYDLVLDAPCQSPCQPYNGQCPPYNGQCPPDNVRCQNLS